MSPLGSHQIQPADQESSNGDCHRLLEQPCQGHQAVLPFLYTCPAWPWLQREDRLREAQFAEWQGCPMNPSAIRQSRSQEGAASSGSFSFPCSDPAFGTSVTRTGVESCSPGCGVVGASLVGRRRLLSRQGVAGGGTPQLLCLVLSSCPLEGAVPRASSCTSSLSPPS